jgi:hypothetical protein
VVLIAGGWRKLHNLYSSPNTIKTIKSRRIRWMGHIRYVVHAIMRNAVSVRNSVRCGLN